MVDYEYSVKIITYLYNHINQRKGVLEKSADSTEHTNLGGRGKPWLVMNTQ